MFCFDGFVYSQRFIREVCAVLQATPGMMQRVNVVAVRVFKDWSKAKIKSVCCTFFYLQELKQQHGADIGLALTDPNISLTNCFCTTMMRLCQGQSADQRLVFFSHQRRQCRCATHPPITARSLTADTATWSPYGGATGFIFYFLFFCLSHLLWCGGRTKPRVVCVWPLRLQIAYEKRERDRERGGLLSWSWISDAFTAHAKETRLPV